MKNKGGLKAAFIFLKFFDIIYISNEKAVEKGDE
jgi:hypothetical protein